MKTNITVLWFLAGTFLLAPLAASAQPPSPADSMHGKRHEKIWAELKLSADQKTKLQALRKQMRETTKPYFEQMKGIMEKGKTELLKPQPSKQVLYGYATQLADIHKQLAEKRVDHMLQVKTILTPEQFSKLLSHQWRGPEGFRTGMGKGHHPGPDEGMGGGGMEE